MHHTKDFEGTIGMVPEHVESLIGGITGGRIVCDGGTGWRTIGTIGFDPFGRKKSFELDPEFETEVRRSAVSPAEWAGTEDVGGKQWRPSSEWLLARNASRLADQIRDLRDFWFYRDNPVHLTYTGEKVLRTALMDEDLAVAPYGEVVVSGL